MRYQYNPDSQTPALAIAAFGSSNPESVSIPNAVFNTGIDDIVSADVGEIIEYFGGLRLLSTIPLEHSHLFKIAESVISFYFKIFSNSTFLNR